MPHPSRIIKTTGFFVFNAFFAKFGDHQCRCDEVNETGLKPIGLRSSFCGTGRFWRTILNSKEVLGFADRVGFSQYEPPLGNAILHYPKEESSSSITNLFFIFDRGLHLIF